MDYEEQIINEVDELINKGDYDKALLILSEQSKADDRMWSRRVDIYRNMEKWDLLLEEGLYMINSMSQTLFEDLDEDLDEDIFDLFYSILCSAYCVSGIACENLGNLKDSRRYYFESLSDTFDRDLLEKRKVHFKEIEQKYVDNFLEQEYKERKLICTIKQVKDYCQESFTVFSMNSLPDISFPIGHPIDGQLYVGHPYCPNKYIPYETYELDLLEDRLRELCEVAQYLGATFIDVKSVNNSSSSEISEIKKEMKGDASFRVNSLKAEANHKKNNSIEKDYYNRFNFSQRFSPNQAPFLPDGLKWYYGEPSWQRLYNQRMQGGLIDHFERMESTGKQVVTYQESTEIEAEFSSLMVKLKGNYVGSAEFRSNMKVDIMLSVHITFAPLDFFKTDSNKVPQLDYKQKNASENVLNTEENKYKDEVLFCLEDDGIISYEERSFLERMRKKLNISESRAEEIESSCLTKLMTPEECEYIEELLDVVTSDGIIHNNVRRLLDRLRRSLNISEERAQDLERSFLNNYSKK